MHLILLYEYTIGLCLPLSHSFALFVLLFGFSLAIGSELAPFHFLVNMLLKHFQRIVLVFNLSLVKSFSSGVAISIIHVSFTSLCLYWWKWKGGDAGHHFCDFLTGCKSHFQMTLKMINTFQHVPETVTGNCQFSAENILPETILLETIKRVRKRMTWLRRMCQHEIKKIQMLIRSVYKKKEAPQNNV